MAGVVEHRDRDGCEPGRDRAVLVRVAGRSHRGELAPQRRQRDRPDAVALDERTAVREQRSQLRGGQRGQHRQAARGQGGGQAHADVRDEARAARRALLDHVQDVAAVQHREVAVVRAGVDEPAQHGAGDPAQRLLARVGRAELERREPEPVAPLLGQVDDEALLAQHGEQVVDGRPRQREVASDGRRRHRAGMCAEQLQQAERLRRGGSVGHATQCLRSQTQAARLG
jgi:hypothetical protein